jgi:hypothetical protein
VGVVEKVRVVCLAKAVVVRLEANILGARLCLMRCGLVRELNVAGWSLGGLPMHVSFKSPRLPFWDSRVGGGFRSALFLGLHL